MVQWRMETDSLAQLSEEYRLGSGVLDPVMANEMFEEDNFILADQDEEGEGEQDQDQDGDEGELDDVIILHMDIREPLSMLQTLLEKKIGLNLNGFRFYLQNAQELEPHKNLVDQCVKGEGLVQINVQIQTISRHINIVDVLKPTEAALAALAQEETYKYSDTTDEDHDTSEDKPHLNWVLDHKFKKEQERLKIPEDPNEWTVPQVKFWFQWAIRQFNLTGFVGSDWYITGKELCALTHEEFRAKIKRDPGNNFWTHLQLLRNSKYVAVVNDKVEKDNKRRQKEKSSSSSGNESASTPKEMKIMRQRSGVLLKSGTPSLSPNSQTQGSPNNVNGSGGFISIGSGNNGQVQLWQFLLEMLTEPGHRNIIHWVGTDGEFKLTDPERVARLWGIKKNKPAMNYEKLSRALRYYYDGDMISKVSGKRFAYKFDCDLKLLIGYDAGELSQLVNGQNNISDDDATVSPEYSNAEQSMEDG